MSKNVHVILHSGIVSLLFAGTYVAIKYLVGCFHPLAFTAVRIGLAALILAPFVSFEEFKGITVRHAPFLAGIGVFGFFLTNLFFIMALGVAPSLNIAIINATQPIMVLFAACCMMRRWPAVTELLALTCALIGVVLVMSDGDLRLFKVHKGELFMILSNLVGVANNLFLQRLSIHFSSLFLTFIGFSVGTLFLLPVGLYHDLVSSLAYLTLNQWLCLGSLAFFCTAISLWLYAELISIVGASKATFITLSLEPLFVGFFSFLFAEPISFVQGIGAVLVIAALFLNFKKDK